MKLTRPDPAQDVVRAYLDFDPDTGVFTRRAALDWRNRRRVGRVTGSVNKVSGYVEIHVGGVKCYAHRLAWIHANGAIPAGAQIDHANRNRSDNRLANLRLATLAENMVNTKVRVDNTSGVKGVSFDRSRGKWAVSVGHKHVGRFDTLFEAAAARRSAALKEYGDFARE